MRPCRGRLVVVSNVRPASVPFNPAVDILKESSSSAAVTRPLTIWCGSPISCTVPPGDRRGGQRGTELADHVGRVAAAIAGSLELRRRRRRGAVAQSDRIHG